MGLEHQGTLVVDDDEEIATMVGDLLLLGGFRPTVFHDSVLAAKAFREGKFEVLVTDLRMPGKGGIELIEEAAAFDPGVGVVLMTATPGDLKREIEIFRNGGVHIELLAKPFDIVTLFSRVNKVRQPI